MDMDDVATTTTIPETPSLSLSGLVVRRPQPRHNNNNNNHHQYKYVVASSGCYGAALSNGAEYTGIYTIEKDNGTPNTSTISHPNKNADEVQLLSQIIYDFHFEKLQAILKNDNPLVDGIAIETVPSYLECQVLRQLLTSDDIVHDPKMKHVACYVSLSCQNGSQLNDGTPLVDALRVFHDVTTIQAIGLNCCSIRYLPDLVRILLMDIVHHTPHRGMVIFPNSGELWDGIKKQWYPDPDELIRSSGDETTTTATNAAITLMNSVIHHVDTIWEELFPQRQNDNNIDTVNATTSNIKIPPLPIIQRKPSILIGGCCRMTVETIAALRQLVDEYNCQEHNTWNHGL
jgi:homocysteine S-methyltransferase